jgi:hypothetical protein
MESADQTSAALPTAATIASTGGMRKRLTIGVSAGCEDRAHDPREVAIPRAERVGEVAGQPVEELSERPRLDELVGRDGADAEGANTGA